MGAAPAAPEPSSGEAFALLHHGVQRQLWRMRWSHLRPLQVAAIREILGRPLGPPMPRLILAARTAAGKTEAAFLPILSDISLQRQQGRLRGVAALYVGPLKALINDQFARVERLCTYLNLPVHRWHGDVSQAAKQRLVTSAAEGGAHEQGGVLLITPESLESLFVNRPDRLVALFGNLRWVVIDEFHAFLGTVRGRHLRSLLCRLDDLVGDFGRLGLSATLGDVRDAKAFLAGDAHLPVGYVAGDGEAKEVRFQIRGYRVPPVGPKAPPEEVMEAFLAADRRIASDLLTHCAGRSNLVFANSKAEVEQMADLVQEEARAHGVGDRFLVHHGSLSAAVREETELRMREAESAARPATTFCSSTLEMGIDIGSVQAIGQIGVPYSVAACKQRLGRSGRKDGQPQVMRIYVKCEEPPAEADLLRRLYLPLVQAVAVAELMLVDGWVEPPAEDRGDLSTLIHQVISVISQRGEVTAADLHKMLCARGAWPHVAPTLFATLLRRLGEREINVIEQTASGGLILGLFGETLRRAKDYYPAFKVPRDYAVRHKSQQIGTVSFAPSVGECFLLAGQRWEAREIDETALVIAVIPAAGARLPVFLMGDGTLVHRGVRQKMRQVLSDSAIPAYLDDGAAHYLAEARTVAAASSLCESSMLPLSGKRTLLMSWDGDRAQLTLVALFRLAGYQAENEGICIDVPADVAVCEQVLRDFIASPPMAEVLVPYLLFPRRRKYDDLLSEGLWQLSVATDVFDIGAATAAVRMLLDRSSVD